MKYGGVDIKKSCFVSQVNCLHDSKSNLDFLDLKRIANCYELYDINT